MHARVNTVVKKLYLREKSQETQTAYISVDSFCSYIADNQLYIGDIFSMKTSRNCILKNTYSIWCNIGNTFDILRFLCVQTLDLEAATILLNHFEL